MRFGFDLEPPILPAIAPVTELKGRPIVAAFSEVMNGTNYFNSDFSALMSRRNVSGGLAS